MDYSEVDLQRVREDRLLIDEVDKWLYELVEPYIGQRVLEVGCGLGNFTHHLVDRELYIGTDLSPESVIDISNRYSGRANFLAVSVDVTDENIIDLSSHQIDTVFSLNVFEHIEDDQRAMKNVAKILQPGGQAIIVVPAHLWLYGAMDKAIGHYRRYSEETMSTLFGNASLQCEMAMYTNFLGALGWFVNGRLRGKQTPPSGQLKTFNKLVPTLKKIENAVPIPFGISLIAVGRKQG